MHTHFHVYLQVSRCQGLKVLQECIYYWLYQLIRGSDKEMKSQGLWRYVVCPTVPSNGRRMFTEEKFLISTEANMWKILPHLMALTWKKADFPNLTKFLKITGCHQKVVTLKETFVTYQKKQPTTLEGWLKYLFLLGAENTQRKAWCVMNRLSKSG